VPLACVGPLFFESEDDYDEMHEGGCAHPEMSVAGDGHGAEQSCKTNSGCGGGLEGEEWDGDDVDRKYLSASILAKIESGNQVVINGRSLW
jgi:hypothetical protein